MQAIVETLFDTVYLFSVITIGILMIRKSKGNRQVTQANGDAVFNAAEPYFTPAHLLAPLS